MLNLTLLAKRAAAATDEELSLEIAKLTRFSTEDMNALFPKRADKQLLLELLALVNAATTENEKAAALNKNISKYSKIVIKMAKNMIIG